MKKEMVDFEALSDELVALQESKRKKVAENDVFWVVRKKALDKALDVVSQYGLEEALLIVTEYAAFYKYRVEPCENADVAFIAVVDAFRYLRDINNLNKKMIYEREVR